MKIPCFRCGTEIDTPNASNAFYVLASDIVVKEPRTILTALIHNAKTLAKVASKEEIADKEYDRQEISSIEEATKLVGFAKASVKVEDRDVEKTGIICPKCKKPGDFVIWGARKQGSG